MPRAGEDVFRSIYVTIMIASATTAYPSPYSKVCDTFRPRVRLVATTRTDLGRKFLVHFFKQSPVRNRFVAEHVSKGRPGCVIDAFRHLGLGEFRGRHVADRDVIELIHQAVREFVLEISTRIRSIGVKISSLPLLSRPLSLSKSLFNLAKMARIFDFLASGQRCEVLEAKIDADTANRYSRLNIGYLDANVKEPVASRVSGEVCSIFDLRANWKWSTLKDLEFTTMKVEPLRRFFDVASLERNPTK